MCIAMNGDQLSPGPVRDQHLEPQLRGPPGQGRPDVPRLAADRRRVGASRASSPTRGPCPGSKPRRPSAGGTERCPSRSARSPRTVVPLAAENVDTDQIVPARYLKVTDKDGLADALFRDWRFEEDGSRKDPPFVLDRPGHGRPQDPARRRQLRDRQLARARAVGARARGASGPSCRPRSPTSSAATPSRTGCCRSSSTRRPTAGCSSSSSATRTPSCASTSSEQGVLLPDGSTIDFEIDPFSKLMLLAGTDEIGYVLDHEDAIDAWEAVHPARVDTRLGRRPADPSARGLAARRREPRPGAPSSAGHDQPSHLDLAPADARRGPRDRRRRARPAAPRPRRRPRVPSPGPSAVPPR